MTGFQERHEDDTPDRSQRDLILSELDRNMLVEAAAGTGKTTSMVLRMLALLRTGRCSRPGNMAAITFTRKAAGEIRSRFQVELERAARSASGIERERLQAALDDVEQCYIGTIHSFCARLLRERPVEAGVDPSFQEIDEAEDVGLREEAWERFSSFAGGHDAGKMPTDLRELGMSLSDLRTAFLTLADFPDVEEWPLPSEINLENIASKARRELRAYLAHARDLQPRLPATAERDSLIPLLKSLPRVASHYDLHRTAELMQVLEYCDRRVKTVQKVWERGAGLTRENATEEERRWKSFREETVVPALRAWREMRYGTVMRILAAVNDAYGRLKEERGCLNFQDLLMRAAALLRDNTGVRSYFQHRFTHLLVDEFQDTDPIQAEVILLLTSSDIRERNWRRCNPRPGSLFLVGDPKQSIYRFRRADIVTYQEVKRLLLESGGLVATLSANFRALPSLIDWVNRVFEPAGDGDVKNGATAGFPREGSERSPAYVAFLPARREDASGHLQDIYRLPVPSELKNKGEILPFEAEIIARFIRHALDTGMTIPRSQRERELGFPPQVLPSDFMILTPKSKNLSHYAEKLQEYGIPHQVSSGGAFKDVEELRLLYLCLQSIIRPHDSVALVAVLRSELFGISDAALYSYKKRGGAFSFSASIPTGLPSGTELSFRDAFSRLEKYREWLHRMPPAAACEKIASDLGLVALAAAHPGGDMRAGGLFKALELLRHAGRESWSVTQLVAFLGRILDEEDRSEGVSVLPSELPGVRVLNLHKAKGLEAPVVFLADPTGEYSHRIERHVDRSGGTTRGYLAIYGGEGYAPKLLAHPADWESLLARESAFLDAEALRLRYVAATRAGVACIITVRESDGHRNPWKYFEEYVRDKPALPLPLEVNPPLSEGEALHVEEIREAARRITRSLAEAARPTYQVLPAKEYALVMPGEAAQHPVLEAAGFPAHKGTSPPRESGDAGVEIPAAREEHGMEWGEVIHLLLQAAMKKPHADLLSLALAALQEKDMDISLAEEAVLAARAITRTPLWERARKSGCCLAETPFHILRVDGSGTPTVVRGVVDLAFRERDGWVDYKTGGPGGGKSRGLEPDYASQILLYAQAWEQCTGQKVKETLVYLVEADLLYRVS